MKHYKEAPANPSYLSTDKTLKTGKSKNFQINLKHKLRLELWPDEEMVICAYGQQMDIWGDDVFYCTIITKTTMTNESRDEIIRLLQR